jgi:hypothetical protein
MLQSEILTPPHRTIYKRLLGAQCILLIRNVYLHPLDTRRALAAAAAAALELGWATFFSLL